MNGDGREKRQCGHDVFACAIHSPQLALWPRTRHAQTPRELLTLCPPHADDEGERLSGLPGDALIASRHGVTKAAFGCAGSVFARKAQRNRNRLGVGGAVNDNDGRGREQRE